MNYTLQIHCYRWHQHDRHPYDHFSLVESFSPIANRKYVLDLWRISRSQFCHHFCQQFDDVNNIIVAAHNPFLDFSLPGGNLVWTWDLDMRNLSLSKWRKCKIEFYSFFKNSNFKKWMICKNLKFSKIFTIFSDVSF